jgi:hypothetical protein
MNEVNRAYAEVQLENVHDVSVTLRGKESVRITTSRFTIYVTPAILDEIYNQVLKLKLNSGERENG